MDGELRLADPGHPLDHRDRRRSVGVPVVAEGVTELAEFGGTADEPGQVGRQPVLDPYHGGSLGLPACHP
ncbi:hypothetical protein [Micromonospora sp. NBS 11-29]|uniref:hypothetical protein n=1 Tax=Micromonospora sp. NBS 11-29 TaxID=1960879 RepID=UPI001C3896BD|nr:hypothetical protein [Micromonospora sp. NBS 11-29]